MPVQVLRCQDHHVGSSDLIRIHTIHIRCCVTLLKLLHINVENSTHCQHCAYNKRVNLLNLTQYKATSYIQLEHWCWSCQQAGLFERTSLRCSQYGCNVHNPTSATRLGPSNTNFFTYKNLHRSAMQVHFTAVCGCNYMQLAGMPLALLCDVQHLHCMYPKTARARLAVCNTQLEQNQ